MYRICKVILTAYIDSMRLFFLRIYLRGEEIVTKRTLRYSRLHEEFRTEMEVEEQFDFWLRRVCRDVKRNDPTIDEVEIDHRGEASTFDEADMKLLRDAMHSNRFVTSLLLRNISINKKSTEYLKDIFQSNSHVLKNIHMEGIQGGDALLACSLALTLNPTSHIQTLHLKENNLDTSTCKAIGLMLKSNRSLTELRLCQNSIDAEGISDISLGLMSNRTIRILDLEGNALNDVSVSKISNALVHNETLEFLCLDFNDFGQFGTRAIASMLQRNRSLKELHLFGNQIDSVGATALANSLRHNLCLKKLILSFNNIGNEGTKALAEALTVNVTLTHLSFPSNNIWNEGLEAFGHYLPKMKGLEVLNVGELYDTPAADALLMGLKSNTRLSALYLQLPVCQEFYSEEDEYSDITSNPNSTTPVEDDINFFLRLNKSGRSLLHSKKSAPLSLWAEALSKANKNQTTSGIPDVLYHLIRQQPELIPKPL